MLHFLTCLLFVFLPQPDSTTVKADSSSAVHSYTVADTTYVGKKNFRPAALEKLKSDSELKYNNPPTEAESWWTRLQQWVLGAIARLLRGATTTTLGQLTLFIIGGTMVVVILMMLMRVNAFRVFFSGADAGQNNYQVLDENIHEMDFEKLLGDAVSKGDFRLATRLVFLHSLKILSDQQLIHWLPGKSNYDYVEELEREDLKSGFRELSLYFDYAWYGNFTVSSEIFGKVEQTFQQWKSRIN